MQWKIISFIHACWLKGTWFEAIMALRKCPGYPWFRQFLKRTPLLDKFMFLSPHQSKAPSPLTCRFEHVWCYKCNQVNVRIGTEGWEENATQTTSNRPEIYDVSFPPFPSSKTQILHFGSLPRPVLRGTGTALAAPAKAAWSEALPSSCLKGWCPMVPCQVSVALSCLVQQFSLRK